MKIFNDFLLLLDISDNLIITKLNDIEIKDFLIEINNMKFFLIIKKLYNNLEALDFLLSHTSKDCRNIQELAGEVHGGNNQNFVSFEDLFFIEKIIESFENIKKIDINNNEKEFIKELTEKIEVRDLENYYKKYQQYKEFFEENLDKKIFTVRIIQKILDDSEFYILNTNTHYFKAFYKDIDNTIIIKEFDYDYMIELRDRALTRYKISDSVLNENNQFNQDLKEQENIIIENNEIFIECVSQIDKLLKLLDKIKSKGFFYLFEETENNKNGNPIFNYLDIINKIKIYLFLKIKITILKNATNSGDNRNEQSPYIIKYYFDKKEKENFHELYNEIYNIYTKIKSIQKNAYLKDEYINFIYGKQFYLFLDYFLSNKISENLKYFLSYFLNKENIINIDFKYKNIPFDKNEDQNLSFYNFYDNFIEQSKEYIIQLLNKNDTNLEKIYQQNKIITKKIYNGIYINGCINLENEIIQWYKYFTNNLPLASTLLLCKQDTTSDEIISFLYRSILCKYNICFCMAKTEILSKENKNIILETINDIFETKGENNYKMNSCLFIMNNNLNDELCKSLFCLKYIKPLDISNDNIKNFEENKDEKIKIIDSDHSGEGKSTYIKNLNKKDDEYVYFPIGGIFTKENTLKRLKLLNKNKNINNNNNVKFHIDLYDTDEKSLMNDFLYFILITKLYGQDNNIFYLSKNIKIYLEVPNSFINFYEIFQF